jgi:hypothetical protein
MTSTKGSVSPKGSPPAPVVTPLKPRRGLLVVSSVVFSLWVVAMIVMYVTTVYPHRHPKNASTVSTTEETR